MKEFAVYNGHGLKQIGAYSTLDLAEREARRMNTHPGNPSQTYHGAECDLESLVNQMLCEHGEIQDLREKLRHAEKRYELLGARIQQIRKTIKNSQDIRDEVYALCQCPDRAADAQGVAVNSYEKDLGAVELYDDYTNWQDAYADAVGISRWREL